MTGWKEKLGTFWWAILKAAIHVAVAIPATWGLVWFWRWMGNSLPQLSAVWTLMWIVVGMELIQQLRGQRVWKLALDLVTWGLASSLTAMWLG